MRKIILCILTIAMAISSFTGYSQQINMIRSYYLLKYEYNTFLQPLLNYGATEAELIAYFGDVEEYLKGYDNLTIDNIDAPLKNAVYDVAMYRNHRHLSSVISGCYNDQITEYMDTDVIPVEFRDVYDAVKRSLFEEDPVDKYDLVFKYEDCVKFVVANTGKYYDGGMKSFMAVLDKVYIVLSNKNATQEDVNDSVVMIDDAFTVLGQYKIPTSSGGGGGGVSNKPIPTPTPTIEPSEKPSERPSESPTGQPSEKPVEDDKIAFTDVDKEHWANDAIIYLAENKIIDGFEDKSFRPEDNVTREQFSKIICEALKLTQGDEINFVDVPPEKWSYEYVSKVVKSGLMVGTDDELFGADDVLIRQDLALIAYRITESGMVSKQFKTENNVTEYNDSLIISIYAKDAVDKMQSYGIMSGMGGNLFVPYGIVTRAQAAQMIYSLVK